jgi:hypothetical protein
MTFKVMKVNKATLKGKSTQTKQYLTCDALSSTSPRTYLALFANQHLPAGIDGQ